MQRHQAAEMIVLLENYIEKRRQARDRAFERWLADTLGWARQFTAAELHGLQEVPPSHLMSMGLKPAIDAWAGIDRTVAIESLQHVKCEPITLESIREAMVRALEYRPPPPTKPWLRRERAHELIAEGVSPALISAMFEIY
jgi:hypothetical protein